MRTARSRHPRDQTPPEAGTSPRDQTLPPPVNRMTDACENIPLPQLRCGR